MEYRQLGRSGLRVSTLTLGTMTFGGKGVFRSVGQTDLEGARHQIDLALDAGDPAANVRTVLSLSYRHLPETAARMFRLLGLHPGPDISAAKAKIEEHRRWHDRHTRDAHIEANATFLENAHDARRRVQSEGAAAR